jgi:septum formation inhibitor-activating ATPase MinD
MAGKVIVLSSGKGGVGKTTKTANLGVVLRPLDMRLIAGADEALVVGTPEVSSVRDADRVVGLLEKAGICDVRLIINRCRHEMIAKHDQISVADIEELFDAPALAIFPDDPAVIISTNRGEPLALDKHAKLRKTFEGMATAIAGQEIHAGIVRVLASMALAAQQEVCA